MTDDEYKSLNPLYDALGNVEKYSENLQTKLPFGITQIKKKIPADQNQKKLLSAAKTLLSRVASSFKTVKAVLDIPDKELKALSIAGFKEKLTKAMKSSRSASDWGTTYFTAYQRLQKAGWSPSAEELMVLQCYTYSNYLIEAVSNSQIQYNILK